MSLTPSPCSDATSVKRLCREAGAVAVGITSAAPVARVEIDAFDAWSADGCHASMDYLVRYPHLRHSPSTLLDGARAVVVAAFPYAGTTPMPSPGGLRWARYALGDDYHDVVRRRLTEVASQMAGRSRVCVDTAPLRERLLAVRAGIGFIGRNNMLILPAAGSYVVLGEIITTLPLTPDLPSTESCLGCDACLRACPGRALSADPGGRVRLDARRCLSYLTIEHPTSDTSTPLLDNRIYGCDVCQEVCPHNSEASLPAPLPEFEPRREILSLTRYDILTLTPERYAAIFRHSAIKRAKLAGLQASAWRLS